MSKRRKTGAMKFDRRWQSVLLGRIVANAVAGAIGLAIPAMMGGGIAGAVWDWINNATNAALLIPSVGLSPHIGANVGIGGGFWLGFFIGLALFSIAAARTAPGRTFEPLRALFGRVALGMLAGALGFCSLFLAVEWARAWAQSQPLHMVAVFDSR